MRFLKKKYFSYFVPFFVMLFFAFFEAVFFVQGNKDIFLISLLTCFTFYFSVFNPKRLNILFIFVIGVFSDMLLFFPLGFQSFILCLMAFFAYLFKRSLLSLSFKGQWAVFCGVLLVVSLSGLSLLYLTQSKSVSFLLFFVNYLTIVLSYPFIASFCAFINQKTGANG